MKPLRPIGEDDIRTYEDDGIVCLRGMFDADTVATLREAVERDMAVPGPMAHDVTRSAVRTAGVSASRPSRSATPGL